MEGATFALRFGVDRLCELGIEADEILLTGGGAGSATWRQVVADVCKAPVTVLSQDEGAAFGAALQALSILESETDMQRPGGSAPVEERSALLRTRNSPPSNFYDEAYAKYQEAVGTITPLYT